jgi:cyclopropane fatty-acyl-phospholipid synthase-like methyltransferase
MLLEKIANQFKKPTGILGFITSKIMDKGNINVIEWVYSLLDFKDNENILEIGYGSGILINKIAKNDKKVKIYGIDFSKVMFDRANKSNRTYLEKGDVKLSFGDILDYNEELVLFDKIIAINVIYFWNNLNLYLKHIYEILNKSGKIYFYMADSDAMKKAKFTTTNIFNKYRVDDVIDELKKLNFKNIKFETSKTNFEKAYCIIAEK